MSAAPIRDRIIVALHDAECSEQRCDIATFAKHYGPQADAVLAAIPDPARVLEVEADHAEATIGGYGDHIAIHLRNRAQTYRQGADQ